MKKALLIGLFVVLSPLHLLNKTLPQVTSSFFGVYGKSAMAMGTVGGSDLEVWIYPYKVFHDFRFHVIVQKVRHDPYQRLKTVDHTPAFFTRLYAGEKWQIREQIFPAYDRGMVFIIYHIHANDDLQFELSFKPDLSPMWPASLGGKYSYWHSEGFFVMGEASGKNRALFGSGSGQKVGDLPAHKLPGGRIRQVINLAKGTHHLPFVAVAGQTKFQELKGKFSYGLKNASALLQKRKEALQQFRDNHLQLQTPYPWINKALRWAIMNLHLAMVKNPSLGEGLIAGYGLSQATERPGFAWYFGGDGLINAFALLDCADFKGARKELEFLFQYQRKDGKIIHELSQGAGFIRWFKDYGFAYFHGDTTLYFLTFLDFYVKRTGDTSLLKKYQSKINRCLSWLQQCDADGNGIVDTPLAGTGASETGPLRQKMKTDIFLASLSVKAWQALEHIYSLLRRKTKAGLARKQSLKAARALEALFWMKDHEYYAYAVKEDSGQIGEVTIWPAIGMCLGAMDPERCRRSQRLIASPLLSADWGTRFLSSRSKYYHPTSYNNGAVWPFLTGFSSWALYKNGNPFHGHTLLMNNLQLVHDFDTGAPTELLSGDLYIPLDQSVPNQIWSSGNTISAFVKGLLGFKGNALDKTIEVNPHLPLHWPFLRVKKLRVGNGNLDLGIEQLKNRIGIKIESRNLEGYTFKYTPDNSVLQQSLPPKQITINHPKQHLKLEYPLRNYLYPLTTRNLQPGDGCSGPIIEAFELSEDRFQIVVWGRGTVRIHLYTDLPLVPSSGIVKEQQGFKILQLDMGKEWQRQIISGTLGNNP